MEGQLKGRGRKREGKEGKIKFLTVYALCLHSEGSAEVIQKKGVLLLINCKSNSKSKKIYHSLHG